MEREQRIARLAALPFAVPERAFSWWASWKGLIEVVEQRELLAQLIRRDLKSRYKDSALGLVWTLVKPLTQLLVYYLVLGKFLQAERGVPDFAVYIFTGLTIYGLFSEIVSSGTTSIIANAGLVKKVYLPREVFPLASVGTAIVNFLVQLVILLAAAFFVGDGIIYSNLLYALLSVFVIVVCGAALVFLLSALNVYLRDVQYLVEVFLMVLMWGSPIVYSWGMVSGAFGPGPLLDMYTNNPITLAVLGFQQVFWSAGAEAGEYPDFLLERLLVAAMAALVFFFVSQAVFRKLQGNFAQVL